MTNDELRHVIAQLREIGTAMLLRLDECQRGLVLMEGIAREVEARLDASDDTDNEGGD